MNKKKSENDSPTSGSGHLGTFGGVFTPSILTILGIILFLRLGYVVGEAGLLKSLYIILLANIITVLTSLSLAAVATNLKVKGGGYYYIISRTLGLEFGGALGIVLFLAQSVSIGFYCIGFGEALMSIAPGVNPQLAAGLAVAGLFILAWLGADLATRFQYLVMIILGAALISFFAGGFIKWEPSLALANYSSPQGAIPFWAAFAVFFPAVTGFTQGVSMSGDLKDPGKSLPLGTFAAVGISAVVYLAAAVLLAGTLPGQVLRTDFQAMQQTALAGWLILGGVMAATLSSAMASFLGAPRILQSLAQDRIFPFLKVFAKGYGQTGNPRAAVLLSAAIAFATVAMGRLNLIAPVVSMFFLISYGLLNYATYFEARTQSPSFRPRFRLYNKRMSLLGALACAGAMLAINPGAGITALAVLTAVYQYLKRTAGPAIWADSRKSYHMQQIRTHLISASQEVEHARHWRPQILAFSDNPEARPALLRFCSWIEGGSGLTTVVRILSGQKHISEHKRQEMEKELAEDIREVHSSAFPLILAVNEKPRTINILLQTYGLGPVKANTLVLNWFQGDTSDKSGDMPLLPHLYAAFRMQKNIIFLHARNNAHAGEKSNFDHEKRIDVWWWGGATSRLMLLLAHLVTRHSQWHGSFIRVLAPNLDSDPSEQKEILSSMLESYRIQAESMIIMDPDVSSLSEKSRDASLVFLPVALDRHGLHDPFNGNLNDLLDQLPDVALCLAAEDISLNAEPEQGKPAEAAAALENIEDRNKRLSQARKDLEEAETELEKAEKDLDRSKQEGSENQEQAAARGRVRKAADAVKQKEQKAMKAQAQLDQAEEEAEEYMGDRETREE